MVFLDFLSSVLQMLDVNSSNLYEHLIISLFCVCTNNDFTRVSSAIIKKIFYSLINRCVIL